MIKKYKWQFIVSSIFILLPIVVGLLIWNYLPNQIVTHWSTNGEPDGWSGRTIAVFGLPIIILVAHWICVFFTARDAKNKDQSSKVFKMVLWLMPIISLIVCGHIYAIALGNDISLDIMVRILLGLIFVILGNYMPKCKQNYIIGIKVTWTLRNEENWNKTHRFTGRLWVFGGVLLLATMFLPMEIFMYSFIPLILGMAVIPMIYSYTYYRKQSRAGTFTKENTELTPSKKGMTIVPLGIGIAILALAGVFLFTGKFEVQFDEISFTINADYWDDVTINYADIDNIEYREQDNPGMRTFGYGTPFLTMGECENREYGKYTRYAYKSCDYGVVLTVDDKILVINGKDEERTKVIYDELIKKISE